MIYLFIMNFKEALIKLIQKSSLFLGVRKQILLDNLDKMSVKDQVKLYKLLDKSTKLELSKAKVEFKFEQLMSDYNG